jgi:hypothetical protein
MIPAAPFVGAVTTRPPEAFSSLTARAIRFTHSCQYLGSWSLSSFRRRSCQSGARRRTFSPPGSSPSRFRLTSTQPSITE